MMPPRLLRILEVVGALVAVALLAFWTTGRHRSERVATSVSPASIPSSTARAPLRLAGVALKDSEEAVRRVLGSPKFSNSAGPFTTLDFSDLQGSGRINVTLEATGRVVAIIAEGKALSRGSEVLVQPGDPPDRVVQAFGPCSDQTAERLTYRAIPAPGEAPLEFGELTFHLSAGRVSQIALVGTLPF